MKNSIAISPSMANAFGLQKHLSIAKKKEYGKYERMNEFRGSQVKTTC